MSSMNAALILAGRQPNIVNEMERGFQAGRKNALAGLYAEHGAGIAQGDRNALNALSAYDPSISQGAERNRQVINHADAAEARLTRAEARQVQAHAARMSSAARSSEAAKLKNGIKAGLAAQTPEQWDALMTQFGVQSLVGQFENRQAHANRFLTIAQIMEMNEPVKPMSPEGKLEADRRAGFVSEGATQTPDFDTEQKLRKEFIALPTVKDFSKIQDSFDRIQAAATNPTAAGDMALIFNYMKLLDPGSVVRESEYATAANAAGVPDRVRNIYNRILNGERLAEDQRDDFVNRSGQMFNAQAGNYNDRADQYRGLADQYGLTPDNIALAVEMFDAKPEVATAALAEAGMITGQPISQAVLPPPSAGQVVDGHRFKGGDPANPGSWEKVN